MKCSDLTLYAVLGGMVDASVSSVKLHKIPLDLQPERISADNDVQSWFHLSNDVSQQPIQYDLHQYQSVPLTKHRDSHYYVKIQLGSSDHEYKLVVDTGSTAIRLFTSGCTIPEETSERTTLRIGELTVPNQAIWRICMPSGLGRLFGPFDGLLGLSNARDVDNDDEDDDDGDTRKSLLQNMFKAELIEAPLFSIYLGNGSKNDSAITFGGIDRTRFTGAMRYLPLPTLKPNNTIEIHENRPTGWEISLESLDFGETSIPIKAKTQAIFDTGTVYLAIYKNLADILNARYLNATQNAHGENIVSRSLRDVYNTPDLIFRLGPDGEEFALSPRDYIIERKGSENDSSNRECVSGIVGFPRVILGDVFLRKWYSVYDEGENRIGLGRAV